MGTTRLKPLELGRRQARWSRAQRWTAGVVAALAAGAMVAVTAAFFDGAFGAFDADRLREAARRLGDRLLAAPLDLLLELAEPALFVVAAAASLWYARRSTKYERLLLDETGLRYRSPLPEPLHFLQPDWSLQWSQLRAARIVVPKSMPYPHVAVLELDAGAVKRRLAQVPLWSPLAPPGEATDGETPSWRPRFLPSAIDKEEVVRVLEASALVRYLRAAGVALALDIGATTGYALERNRAAIITAAAVILLLAYGVIDLALNEEEYVVRPSLDPFVIVGAAAALAAAIGLASAGVPRAETIGLALLLGGAAAFALYPGMLRLNQTTDGEGLRAHEYRHAGHAAFAPVEPGLPELRFTKYADYWGQFKPGTTHRFELRRGGLGFYQVDMGPVHARMREYYRGQP